MKKFILLSLFISIQAKIAESGAEAETETVKEGNFALSTSQQPGPLLGFGQNIIDKGDFQFYFYSDYIKLRNKKTTDPMPGFLYGIRDDLSMFFNIPITKYIDSADNCKTLAGVSLQCEYAYFSKTNLRSAHQATVLAAISGPNGSMIKQAVSNRQSSTFFIGGTYNYMSVDWYIYTSLGELFSIRQTEESQLGDNFLYQAGIGRNLYHSKDYIYLFLVEMLGAKFKQNIVSSEIDQNSGGNLIFIAPSFWFSSKKLIVQIGFAIPVLQNLNGNQGEYKFQIDGNIGWTF
ncbi:hypothetical protein A3F66_01185 [candidate division TM6 bacterium RIFCSPHIGHO2_12_FULL_32_22]|nr:MAG: hypothetical protein A3F66_01185 [candidate division TM6 bacterium RIFCSPHIGHO2_12_FULL_32_22]